MRLRSFCAIGIATTLLLFVACADQTNPTGVRIPDDPAAPPDGGPPTTTTTQNPDGTATKHLCKVEKVGDAGRVISGTVMLPDGPIDGELQIDSTGMIACAAKDCSKTTGYSTATKIACTDVAISPGLINTHDHIAYANNPPPVRTDEKYEHRHDWREGIRGHTKIPTNAPKVTNAVNAAELRFLMSGMTSTASGGGAGSGAPGLARNIDSNATQLEGLATPVVVSDTFPLDDSDGTLSTTCAGFPAGRETQAGMAADPSYLPHIAEGVDADAHAEFQCQSDDIPAAPDPAHDIVQRQTAVVHAIAVDPNDVAQFRKQTAILSWDPRSNISLYGNTAPVPEFVHLGVPISLGTDWLPSGSMNMGRELACADMMNQKYFGKVLTDRQLWQAVTVNAAFATATDRVIGQLKAGLVGDIAVFDATSKPSAYRAVIEAGVEDTILVLRGGKTMYGDSELISEIGDGDCEDFDVCKITKKACVSKDSGGKVKLSDLQTAATTVYPLFYCKGSTPKNEPTCTPARGPTAADATASVYSGIVTGDQDGDGVKDADDNCPSVFNPIRVMDSGKQGDIDGDGIGDACDKCPLDAGETCTPPDSDDMDGDGVANVDDNCPKDANADQADADGDGKGAACDVCDNAPNPGNSLCPAVFTITQIRNPDAPGHPNPGQARATIKNVVVTAVKNGGTPAGFYVQDDAVQTFGGLFVVSATTVAVGNRVDVVGDYVEFDGTSELSGTTVVTVDDPGTTLNIQPIDTNPADMLTNGEPTEGMLCVIDGPIAVTVVNPDAPADFDEFEIGDQDLRVDDFLFDALDNTFPLGTKFAKVVGICGWSHSARKMWPRSMDDLPPAP